MTATTPNLALSSPATHKLNHKFEKIQRAEIYQLDGDYTKIAGEFSYLDPVSFSLPLCAFFLFVRSCSNEVPHLIEL